MVPWAQLFAAGIGALGVSLVGAAVFAGPLSPARLLCMALAFGGIAGLNVLEDS
jgi:quaternary ammonium compound-resistance protein SugE